MLETTARAAPEPDMIEAMTRCAYELGVIAAGIAKAAGDDTRLFLAFSNEFRQLFFAVRMGLRLKLARAATLAAPVPAPRLAQERREAAERPDPPDPDDSRDRPETDDECERDRDYEPVSLARFLATLRGAATRAERHGDALPAHVRETTLPRLQGLLARSASAPERKPDVAVAVLTRPPPAPPAPGRSRLMSSAGHGAVRPDPWRPGSG